MSVARVVRSLSVVAVCLVLACLAAVLCGGRPVTAAERPNILFIFSDDHAPHAIGAYGSRINVTPNIDRLAREGMLFRRSYCTNSICGPSRAVILTGKHSHLNGFMTNTDSFDGTQVTAPKLLREVGYQTAIVGKWHLVSEPTGFDFWEVLRGQGPYYNPSLRTPRGMEKHVGYTTEIITDRALDFLRNVRDPAKPFFLMYQHKAPHRNWQPGPGYLTKYDDVEIPEPSTLFDDWENRTSAAGTQEMTVARHLSAADLKLVAPGDLTPEQLEVWNAAYEPKNEAFRAANLKGKDLVRWKYQRYIKDYLRCIASMDDNIGRVLEYLDEAGLAENTVVMYSSDQGFYLGDHGWYDKRWMYEESYRMPFIVRWPGVVRPGTVDDRHLIQNLDYAETFLDIARVEIPGDMQGRSLLPLLRGESPADWRQSLYYHYYEFPGAHSVQRHYGVSTDRYKLIRYYQIDEWELFDLERDPDELRSVYGDPEYRDVATRLAIELGRLQERYGDTEPEVDGETIRQRRIQEKARSVEVELAASFAGRDADVSASLDPSGKPLTVGAWVSPQSSHGVVVAQGGASFGYVLFVRDSRPCFGVRSGGIYREAVGAKSLPLGRRVHLAGVLRPSGLVEVWVDGAEDGKAEGLLISSRPSDGLSIGADTGSLVGTYGTTNPLEGEIGDVRIYWGALGRTALESWAAE